MKKTSKIIVAMLAILMAVSTAWIFDGKSNVAYAADDSYYITESQEGLTVTENMVAPKPTTAGKENYIFAGYYVEATCETPITETTDATVYKKFVPTDIMTVKAQVTKGTAEDTEKTDMRLVTTVDGLNYKEVGFDVYFNGSQTAVNAKTTTVYKRIIAADSGNAFGYSPEAFSTDAEYFTTVNLVNIANKNFDKTFFIKPYWKTMDGTKVYGMSRMARVSDSYNGIVNVPVRLYTDATVNAGTFSVAYDANVLSYIGYDNGDIFASVAATDDANGNVTVTTPSEVTGADSMVANLRFQVKEGQTMPSNSTFAVTGDFGTAIASVEYKVFSVTYNGVADTSWYDEFKDGNEFVLTTPADLYGFAKIVNASSGDYKTELFKGDTVRLGADVVINKGDAEDWGTTAPTYAWTPIGYNATYLFAGTFDGCGHTIEGIYMVDNYENRTASDAHFSGLFGITVAGSTIRNFKLTNSYFESKIGMSSQALMGSVIGQNGGDIDSVYSNAIVKSAFMTVGGLVGRCNPGNEGTSYMSNCWFDGSLTIVASTYSTGSNGVGGILGRTFKGKVEITDCLNTADISYSTTVETTTATSHTLLIGGINGGTHTAGSNTLITSCVNAGTISYTLPTGVTGKNVGSISGWATTTNCIDAAGTKAENYNGYKGYTAGKASLSFYDKKDEVPGAWVCRATADSAIKGIPALKSFCDEWIDVSWYYNDTAAKEFTISSAEAFYGWSELSNKASVYLASDVTVKLGADIKMNNGKASVWATTTNTSITEALRNWTPIKTFAGTFDGQMHTISGVYLNTSLQKAGLFAEQSGTVSNFYLKNSYLNSTYNTGSTGANSGAYFGSVVGVNRGTISTVYSDAIVQSVHSQVGGIVGRTVNASSIKECWFDGEVNLTTSKGWYSGGIVGYGYIEGGHTDVVFDIQDCLFTGTITTQANAGTSTWGIGIGAFLGQSYSPVDFTVNIENCVSAGSINVPAATGSATGTGIIVGCIESARSHYIFTNVYGTNESCTKTQSPYYHRSGTNAPITGEVVMLSEADIQGVKGYKNTNLDFEETWAARMNQVSALAVFVDQAIDLTYAYKPDTSWYNADAKVQEIQDEADMYGFLELMLGGNTFAGKEVQLKADLNMNHVDAETLKNWKDGKEVPVNEWLPATKFAGTFDGQMHTISGIYMNATVKQSGLFGWLTSAGVVKNVYITDSLFKSTNTELGSVVGYSQGLISTVYSDATVVSSANNSGGIVGSVSDKATIEKCWFGGTIETSRLQSGGILGYIAYANGLVNVKDCLYTGKIIFTTTSSNWGLRIGGIIGGAHDYHTPTITIENCMSAGAITQKSGSTATPAVSAVYGGFDEGRATKLNLTNVYGTNECFAQSRIYHQYIASGGATAATLKITGKGIMKAKSDLLGTAGYQNTLLDFEEDGAWVARKDNVPGLKAFTKVIGETVSIESVEQNNWYNANETVFGIGSASALQSLAIYTNGTNKIDFKDKTILLMDDIEINPVEEGTLSAWHAGTGTLPTSWTPIGVGVAFNGTLDGQMHTISGLYMKVTNNTNTSQWTGLGLFARTAYYSTLKNFSLVDSYLRVYDSNGNQNNAGYIANLGSIVGYHHGYMSTVYSNARIVSNRKMVGGIMGYSNSRGVTNVWYDGAMTLSGPHGREVGGIVGVMDSGNPFENILFTGSISYDADRSDAGIGGIFGITLSSRTNAISLKNVISDGTRNKGQWGGDQAVGSFAGLLYQAPVNVENVYVITDTWSSTHNIYSGGAGAISGTITQLAEADLIGGLAYVNTSLDFENTWVLRNNDVPGLKAFAENEVNVDDIIVPDTTWYDDAATTLQIQDEADMYGFMKLMNEGKTFAGKTVTLEANLEMNTVDANTVKAWQVGTKVPANKWTVSNTNKYATFEGTFNGNDHTISGVYCAGDGIRTGLFGCVETEGAVKNFRLTDSYFNHKNTTGYAGGVAAELYGPIENVYSNAVVDSKATQTGGLVGIMSGPSYKIGNTVSEQKTTTDGNGNTIITVTNTTTYGRHTRTVKNCWFAGEVNVTITKADERVGGLVATVSQGKVNFENCLFTGKISTKDSVNSTRIGGFVGSRTSQSVEKTSTKNGTPVANETTGKTITTNTVTVSKYIFEEDGSDGHTTVNVDSCIAAGEIVDNGDGNAVIGAATGYLEHGKMTNTFATRDTYSVPHVNKATYEGLAIPTYNTDRLMGYCVEEKYGSKLDFANDWSMRLSGVPVPKIFANMAGVGTIVEPATLTAELGLDTWNGTLASAVDYGLGNYVVSYTSNLAKYEAYLQVLDENLGFEKYTDNSESDMDNDGVYNAVYAKTAGDWVLDITFVERESKIYISISTVGENGLSPYLKASAENIALANSEGEVSFTMLELISEYGNGFVFKLPNGHFIVNDGGKAGDVVNLVKVLKEQAGKDKVIIDAWIFTHLHFDHCGAAREFLANASLREGIHVNGIYLSEPNLNVKTMYENEYAQANEAFAGLMSLTQEDGKSKPAVYRMHMGERYYFSGMTVDVVQAQEQIPSDTYRDYNDPDYINTMSTNCVYTLKNTGKKILLGGDSTNRNMRYIMMAYGTESNGGGSSLTLSNINFFAAYHHGKDTTATYRSATWDDVTAAVNRGDYGDRHIEATTEYADYLLKNKNNADGFKFDTVLFPYHQVFDTVLSDKTQLYTHVLYGEKYLYLYEGDDGSVVFPWNMSAINTYLIKNANSYYTYGFDEYDMNGNRLEDVERHGSVQFIFKTDKTVETIVHPTIIEETE